MNGQRSADVVVVGAGVIGCAIAWRLAQRGLRVTLIERAEPGKEASGAAAGILAAQIEAGGAGPFFDLLWRSERLYPAFVEELQEATDSSLDYQRCGALQVAFESEELARLEGQSRWQLTQGLPLEDWNQAALRFREPALSELLVGGTFFPEAGRIDPLHLTRALHRAASLAGVSTLYGTVEDLQTQGDRALGVRLNGSLVPAEQTIVAAGAWSALLVSAGLASTGIEPVRGQMLSYLLERPPPLRSVVFGSGGYLVPRASGRLLVGSTSERVGYERGVTPEGLSALQERANRLCPALIAQAPASSWSGFRPATADGWPALGTTPLRGLQLAVGHFRNGILLAPITAELLVDSLAGRSAIPAPFAAGRLFV